MFSILFDVRFATALMLLAACADGDVAARGSELSDIVNSKDLYDVEEKQVESPVQDSYDIYASDRLPVFKIVLDPFWEDELRREPREYVPAMLELVDGDDSEPPIEVGLKLKGSGSFRDLDGKAALRIRIDKYQKDQTLRGLTDLTLNNMIQDASMMAERLAYVAFRELGVPAPRSNHALVYLNDIYFGVYANIETPNEGFLARWFQDSTRNLYEQTGKDVDAEGAADGFELETNEKNPGDRAPLHALEDAARGWDLARVRELVDWPKFLLFSALEAACNQTDGYSYAQVQPNNFRIYDSTEALVFLPWGLDWALSNVATQDGSLFVDPLWVRPTHGVLMRMCLADEQCRSEYKDVVEIVASRWDDLKLEEHMDQWSEQIDEAFRADTRRESTVEDTFANREVRRTIIRGRAAALREDIAADRNPED